MKFSTATTLRPFQRCLVAVLVVATTTTTTTAWTTTASSKVNVAGIQSGPDTGTGSYASSVVYSPSDHAIWMTGTSSGQWFDAATTTTAASSEQRPPDEPTTACFVAVAKLPNLNLNPTMTSGEDSLLRFVSKSKLEQQGSCTTMHPLTLEASLSDTSFGQQLNANHVIVAGHREMQIESQYGFLLDVKYSQPNSAFETIGNDEYVVDDAKFWFPAGVAHFPSQPEEFYVAYMKQPEGGRVMGMGKYIATIGEDLAEGEPSIQDVYEESYESESAEVVISDLVAFEDGLAVGDGEPFLILAGSTSGSGDAFWLEGLTDSSQGFILKIDPEIGYRMEDTEPLRIQTVNEKDVSIQQVCVNTETVENNYMYVVGTTSDGGRFEGVPEDVALDTSAFLMKIDIPLMTIVWTKQFSAVPSSQPGRIKGMACAVAANDYVWVGGTVWKDSVIRGADETASFGGNDVWVAKVAAGTGESIFVHQMGTSANDEMATQGGLNIDKNGNAILVGNTNGSFYRARESDEPTTTTDVFIMTVDKETGETRNPFEFANAAAPLDAEPVMDNTQGGNELINNISNNIGDLVTNDQDNVDAEKEQAKKDMIDNIRSSDYITPVQPEPHLINNAELDEVEVSNDDNNKKKRTSGIFFVALGSVGVALLAYMYVNNERAKCQKSTDRTKVTPYLVNFAIEEIEVKRSATNGWHCSYNGPLARGSKTAILRVEQRSQLNNPFKDSRPEDDQDPSSTSGTMCDSLYATPFMDIPSSGSSDSGEDIPLSTQKEDVLIIRNGYSDLLDMYKSSSDDEGGNSSDKDAGVHLSQVARRHAFLEDNTATDRKSWRNNIV